MPKYKLDICLPANATKTVDTNLNHDSSLCSELFKTKANQVPKSCFILSIRSVTLFLCMVLPNPVIRDETRLHNAQYDKVNFDLRPR